MQNKIKTLITVLLIICISFGIYIGLKIFKKWPEGVVFSNGSTKFYTEDGMYYFENSTLKFYDHRTDTSVVVCSKPNCEHKDDTCNARFDSLPFSGSMMIYDNKIYIETFNSKSWYDEDEISHTETVCRFEQLDLDGNNRKLIYTSDNGSITSKLAVDGKLYFTTWEYQNGFEENSYLNDCTLYCYDINWGKNREICSFKGNESEYAATLEILNTPDAASCLYLLYDYWDKDSFFDFDLEAKETIKLISYQDGDIKEQEIPGNMSIHTITEEGTYCSFYDEETDTEEFCFIDQSGEENRLLEYDFCHVYDYPGFFYFINSDENKLLYDYENDIWYIANTSIREEEKWISDIYYIDRDQDLIYYNPTDFTGISPGSSITIDMMQYTSGSWKQFLQENFTVYDGEKYEWFTFIKE